MVAAEIVDANTVSLVIALAALVISAASYWSSAGKPADIVGDHLPADDEVAKGAIGDIPSISRITLTVAITNEGARAGLLEALSVEHVAAPGSPEFATGEVVGPNYADSELVVHEIGTNERAAFPMSLAGGEVRAFRLEFQMGGPFHTEANTQHRDVPPSRQPLAQMLIPLERVDVTIEWEYRTRVGFVRTRRKTKRQSLPIPIDGEVFAENAIEAWKAANMTSLWRIVEEGRAKR